MNKKIWFIIVGILVVVGGFFAWKSFSKKDTTVTYETEAAEKGALTTSVSASGTISSSNTYDITTSVSGTISKVYVSNGDQVTEGQAIADIEMDDTAKQEKTTLYSSYLSAQNAVETAKQDKLSLSAQIDQNKASVVTTQANVDYANSHDNPTTKSGYTDSEKEELSLKLSQAQKTLQLSEQKYSQADTAITLAETKLTSAYLEYENYSTTIKAPATGKIISLSYEAGDTLSSKTSSSSSSSSSSSTGTTSSNSSSSNSIGTIVKESNDKLQAEVTITEADIAKAKQDQKVTITIDALSSDITYTGKVLSIDTTGSVSSGVTTYSAIIEFDENVENAYSNMNVTANITTNIVNDVILVSSSAVTTNDSVSTVQVLKNGTPETVTVETGDSNDTQTVIKSGVSVGDEIVTQTNSSSTTTSKATSTGSSIFGSSSNNRSSNSGGMPAGGTGGM